MSAKYKSPSFLLPNELNTSANTANDTGINSLYSMDLDVGNKYIDCGNGLGDSLGTYTGDLSFSFWINRPTAANSKGILYFGSFSSARGALEIYADTNVITLYINGNTKTISYTNTNTWDNICIIYKSGDISNSKIYLNGSEPTATDTGSFPSSLSFTGKKTIIGGYYGSAYTFNGKIDEVAIFNKALSTTEIAALYEGTSPNIYPSNLIASNLNPIAYYPLGEQAQMQGYLGNEASSEWQFPNGVLQDYVMDFDPGYIDCGNEDSVNITGALTVSAWVKPNTAVNGNFSFVSKAGNYPSSNYILRGYSTGARFFLNGTTHSGTTSSSFVAGEWVNLIGIFRPGQSVDLYWNGSLSDGSTTSTSTTTISTITNPLLIGSNNDQSYIFDGEMSNVAIWNSDQTTNVANIYNNGSPQTTYTVTPQNWWKLNADSVYTPSAPNYTTALDFDGADDYIDCGTSQLVDFNSSFTISAWVYITSTASGYDAVYAFKGASHAFVMFFNNGSGYSPISFGSANYLGGDGTIRCATNVTINQWNNIVVVYNGNGITSPSNYTFYINNKSQTLTTSSGFSNVVNANYIGRYDPSHDFDGSISNVAVFNSALSPSQVSTLFNFGTPETNISFSPQAWWKLDNTTTGIQDSSGNGNNGTNNGATQVSSSVAVVPSWKIPTALSIPSVNYTKSLEFDPSGSGDYISFGNQSAFKPTSNYTFSIWFNGDSASYALFGTNSNTGTGVHALLTGSKILYYHGNQPVLNVAHAGLNIWQNFTVTWSSSTGIIRTFIDGKFVDERTGVNSITWSNDLEVGRINSGQWKYDGKLSNFAMWNTTLTDGFSGTPTQGNVAGGQVAEVYNNGQPQASITGSPVGWWKLNDQNTITDYSGNNYTGTNNGAVDASGDVTTSDFSIPVNGVSTTLPSTALQQSNLQFDSPYSNYSLKFSTTQSIDTNFTLPASYTSYSYSFWYRSTAASLGTGDYYIISNFDSSNTNLSGTRGAVRFNNSTKMRIFGGDNTNYYLRQYEVGSSLLDQQWHNVIVTFTNTEVLLYIDGVSISAETTTNTPITGFAANRSYTIGQSGINSGYLINSKLDEFAIFNKKLTEAEILSIYNNGKPGDMSTLSPTNWWRLGENAYFVNNNITLPNSVSGAPNGVSSGTATSMLSADAPGTYANGVGSNLDIIDRVGDAPLSIANSQSYNMIPDDKIPYVPGYVGLQTTNNSEFTFDGIDDFFSASGNNISGNKTVSLWFYADDITLSDTLFEIMPDPNSNDYLQVWTFGSKILAASGPNNSNGRSSSTLLSNKWYHLVVTKNTGNVANIYIDGVDDTQTANATLAFTSGGGDTLIGKSTYAGKFFKGKIDEVAIFDKALTADQIQFDLYEPSLPLGNNKTADIANNPNLPTPVAWYRMGD